MPSDSKVDYKNCTLTEANCMDKDFQKLSLIATRLCEKLKEVHDSKEYQGVWSMFMIHGGKYGGPQYGKELKELENYLEINNGLE